MQPMKFSLMRGLTSYSVFLCLTIVSAIAAHADVFTINPALSSLTLSGSTNGSPFMQQGVGSLVTSYFGTIDASFNASSITFNSALVTANNSGSWQPAAGGVAGSEPANYGVPSNSVSAHCTRSHPQSSIQPNQSKSDYPDGFGVRRQPDQPDGAERPSIIWSPASRTEPSTRPASPDRTPRRVACSLSPAESPL